MLHCTLNHDDVQLCVDLACDGVNVHLNEQSTLDVIHKVMYALTEAVQNNQAVVTQLQSKQACQFKLHLQVVG